MKSEEERHREFLGVTEHLVKAMGDALTGESNCPDCGMPIYCNRGHDMNCPHCGVHIMFQGSTPFSDTEILTAYEDEGKAVQRERLRRLGKTRVQLIEVFRLVGRLFYIPSWLPHRIADWLEKGQSFYRVSLDLDDIPNNGANPSKGK